MYYPVWQKLKPKKMARKINNKQKKKKKNIEIMARNRKKKVWKKIGAECVTKNLLHSMVHGEWQKRNIFFDGNKFTSKAIRLNYHNSRHFSKSLLKTLVRGLYYKFQITPHNAAMLIKSQPRFELNLKRNKRIDFELFFALFLFLPDRI